MDIASLTGAMQSLKVAKQLVGAVYEAKVEGDVKERIAAAMERLGDVQEGMFALREELHQLQNERDDLKRRLQAADSWKARADAYQLAETVGGAVVYAFAGQPMHYACPSCFNKQEIHPLQNNRTVTGKYRCTGCEAEYPVEQRKPVQIPKPLAY